jgi:hypothetical protein
VDIVLLLMLWIVVKSIVSYLADDLYTKCIQFIIIIIVVLVFLNF